PARTKVRHRDSSLPDPIKADRPKPARIHPVRILLGTSIRWMKASFPGQPAPENLQADQPGGDWTGSELSSPNARPVRGEGSPGHRASVWNRSVRSEPQLRVSAIATAQRLGCRNLSASLSVVIRTLAGNETSVKLCCFRAAAEILR